jgi:hypothetical protein
MKLTKKEILNSLWILGINLMMPVYAGGDYEIVNLSTRHIDHEFSSLSALKRFLNTNCSYAGKFDELDIDAFVAEKVLNEKNT